MRDDGRLRYAPVRRERGPSAFEVAVGVLASTALLLVFVGSAAGLGLLLWLNLSVRDGSARWPGALLVGAVLVACLWGVVAVTRDLIRGLRAPADPRGHRTNDAR